MNYEEAMEYIGRPQYFGCKLGLRRIKKLMEILGDPQNELRYVHVAGTNGKGSTVSMIASILMEAGYKVGVYTSPALHHFTERMRINNNEISKEHISKFIVLMKEKIEKEPYFTQDPLTEFEIVTALAFQYFREQQCDIVVLETGLGGRLDSTNIIDKNEVAVITTISYDHMDVLGKSLSEIAFEKAGIIKEDCDVILYPQEQKQQMVFDDICRQKKARLHETDFSELTLQACDIAKQIFDYKEYKALEISLLGEHQIRNAAVAIRAIEVLKGKGYAISDNALRSGLKNTKWPGRFEIVNTAPLVVIDGAHNVEGIKSLIDNLQIYFPHKKITFICGVLADKDYKAMIEAVLPLAKRFITVTPLSSRALSAQDLALFLQPYGVDTLVGEKTTEAIRISVESAASDEIICAFGSLYYISEVRTYFGLV